MLDLKTAVDYPANVGEGGDENEPDSNVLNHGCKLQPDMQTVLIRK